ncbi:hypothetical protein GA0074696_5514 [Micromonospora purpureochromogenes]|uniref:Mannosyltransferase (PIG-V) n=1 Tax=Micromonospora purpureochromogenes TaxID=47872 RepID=A0A1C5A801_9ACTN|nr:hypothetical protein [Micromonospora purpureochromogenes]SCF41289.1 hypothetical protein GA0074696_5514 [Micromonospora purpureochromogenes]
MTDGPRDTAADGRAPATGLPARWDRLLGHAGDLVVRVPERWRYVLAVFVGAKVVLGLVGVIALTAWEGAPAAPPADEINTRLEQAAISPHRWISMWFAWDALIYDHLSRQPLTGEWKGGFGFPLLYPFLGRVVAVPLGGNTAMALLLISNVAFLLLLYYALRLGETLLGDDAAARRFTRYLVLLPTAFLFQAALTESLFLCLALATFHYAERGRWVTVGVLGYFLGLSRSVGFLVAVPLALVLLRQHRYRLDPRSLWTYVRTGWPLLLVPAGWLTFMAFCRWKGGGWFAYQRAQEKGWGIRVQNPLPVIWNGLTGDTRDAVRVWFAVAVLAIVVAGVRRIGLPYLVYTVLMVLAPLSMGPPVYKSLLRYLIAAFPVGLVLARWARNATADAWLSAALGLVQGALFVVWLAYWTHFII